MKADYTLAEPLGKRATFGLIVLQTDETLEHEFRRYFDALDVATYVSRVPSGADVTTETLGAMEREIPQAAALLPPSLSFNAIGYGCTSGATVIGPDRVAELVQGAAKVISVTNPITSVIAALNHFGARRIGMVTPYIESVSAPMRDALIAQGFEIANCISFEEKEEAKVARIHPQSIHDAALSLGNDLDAVFLSCTNLRTFDVIQQIEVAMGVPVVSSNQALAWHMAKLSGTMPDTKIGRLMRG